MDAFLDLFTKHRNSVAVLLILGVAFGFVALLLLFLDVKVAGVVNIQLPQVAAGFAVGGLAVVVCLLALAVAKQAMGSPMAAPEETAAEKTESTSVAADAPSPKAATIISRQDSQPPMESPKESVIESPKEPPEEQLSPLSTLIRAAGQTKDLAAFDQAHKDFLFKEEKEDAKAHWDAWALCQRFTEFGQVESFRKLKQKVAEKGCSLYYVVWLAACYEFTEEPVKRKELFEKFYAQALEESYGYLINKYAEVTEKLDGPGAARKIFSTSLPRITKNISKALLLEEFAPLLQRLDEKALAAAAYELIFSLTDSPHTTRFSAGYEQSKIGFEYLSLKNYDIHLRTDPHHDMALNNLGVHCGTFEMPGKSIEYFKKSAETGATLALANLALQYMNRGFYAEAQERLDTAKQSKNPNENVMTHYANLQEKIKKESEAWETALKRGVDEQEFMRQYGTAMLLETTANVSLAGQWVMTDATVVTITQQGASAAGNWSEGDNAVTFAAEIFGRGFSFKVERKPKPPLSLLGSVAASEKGVGYLSLDGKQAVLFCPDRKSDAIGSYVRVS